MEATQHHLVEIKSLSIEFEMSYGRNAVLHDVSFTIPRGKIVALVGESGSGKSLTAQAILGILPRNAHIVNGQILYNSPQTQQVIDIAALGRDSKAMQQLRGNQISIIFQEPMVSLSPVHTLLNQIGEALSLHHQVAKSDIKQRVLLMLEKVGFPDPQRALTQYPFELSGGLRQRAMIAMALICQPTLLIADEPTTALDVTVQAQILNLIKSLQAEFTMSVLLITHDLGVVANMADEVAVMFRGRIVERGPIQSLFSQPRHPYLKALFTALPELGQRHKRLQPLREIKHDTDGMRNRRQAWSEAQRQQAPHLCINTVSKTYYSRHGAWFGTTQAHQAVNALSLDIAVGESFGLVGESGCGKTTLSKLLMGAMQPDSGQITYNDRGNMIELTTLDQHSLRAFRPKMQMVFQDPFSSLSPRMTVLDTLREPLIIHQRGDAAFQLERARELMAMVGLDERYLNRYPHSFSGGQRQRISIARALALEPDLLILDEPVSALDVSVQAQVLNLLRDLQAELGLTYLFISHNLAVVDYIADRVGVMCRGQLVEIATSQQLFNQARHPYTRALLAAIPYADLKHPLNMAELDREHLLSDAWPAPYTLKDGETGQWVEINPGHFVRERSAHEERSNA